MRPHRVIQFGQEPQSIVIFDDFAAAPEAWVEDAAMLSYSRIGVHYPGIRAEVHPRMKEQFASCVMPVAQAVFGVAAEPGLVESCYSIVTTPPAELTPVPDQVFGSHCTPVSALGATSVSVTTVP